MSDTLSILWDRADAKEPIWSGDEIGPGGKEAAEPLIRAGMVAQSTNAVSVVCDACDDGHVEEIVFLESPANSGIRHYISCPQNGRVRVPPYRIAQWALDFRALGRAVASGLELAGQVEEVVADRIWLLGKGSFSGRAREIFLARGLTWTDAARIIGSATRLHAASNAVVLVAGAIPPDAIWNGDKPRILALSAIASLENGKLSIDRDHLASALIEGRRKASAVAAQSFPTPQGTTWPEVRLQVSEHRIRVTARGKTKEFSFQEAGFEERRKKGVPNRLWTLLRIIAMRGGSLQAQDASLDHKARTNLKQYLTELRKCIQALVPNVDGDPIPYNKEERLYRSTVTMSSEETPRLRAPKDAAWSGVSISEARTDMIHIAFRAREAYGVQVHDGDESIGGREAAEREIEQEQEFSLASINLADAQGKLDPRGEALLAVLRGKGVVRISADDDAMLNLCSFLCDWTGIADSPFDFAPNEDKWIAKFEASSEIASPARKSTRRHSCPGKTNESPSP